MPVIITLKDIEEAIDNLNYKSETTLKSKLIHAIRNFYQNESSVEALTSIDVEDLVKSVWDTGDDNELIKNKRKNFSSIKSSVNSDLKKLYSEGKNPRGIIIGHNNVFDISDEAKNKALASIADIFREKGIDAQSRITEILATLGDILTGAISSTNTEEAQEELDRLKNLIGGLSEKLGLPSPEGSGPDKTSAREDVDEKADEGAGIKTIAEKEAQIKGIEEDISAGGKGKELAGITDILKDQGIDVHGKMNKIMDAVREALSDAISSAGPELNSAEAQQIKNLFSNLPEITRTTLPEGSGVEGIDIESGTGTGSEDFSKAAAGDTEAEIVEEIEESSSEEVVEIVEESGDVESSADADGALEEVETSSEEIEEILLDSDTESEIIDETLAAGEVVETVEQTPSDEFNEEITGEDLPAEIAADDSIAPPLEALPEEITVAVEPIPEEEIITDDTVVETAEMLPENNVIEETAIEDNLEELEEVEIVEEAAGNEVEEIIEEQVADTGETPTGQGKAAGEVVEGDLRTRAEILAELADAAKALEKIGPELSNSIYSEKEIKEKAKLLSEEFDRYLTIREKFYNQHILIKGGNYPVGGANRGENEFPEQTANLREFYIGKFPVTNAVFEIFVEKTGYITTAEKYGFGLVYIPRMQKVKNALTGTESFIWNNQLQHKKIPGACWYHPSGPASTLYIKRTHPVVQVSLEDACAFAAWTGKRIPTEKEWEAAARTSRSYLYPWGNIWQEDACNLEKSLLGDTAPVDTYLKYANEYEVADTLGNVLEWTLDPWRKLEPEKESEENYVVKGASWVSGSPVGLTDRQPVYKNAGSNILGFRCIAI